MMEMICKKCGAIYHGEELPLGLVCNCECTDFKVEIDEHALCVEEN